MTGYYLRAKRNGEWKSIEIEYLTDKEIEQIFNKKSKQELIQWIKALKNTIKSWTEYFKELGFDEEEEW